MGIALRQALRGGRPRGMARLLHSAPFSRVLIANRGEIAVRLIRSAQALGMEAVAVHSTPDARALHARLADSSVHIGGAASVDSYLRGEAVINAAISSGAQAVHPGYGFLSENAEFADAVRDAGLAFVGPPAHAIRAMGDKISAKKIAIEAGVPVIPGAAGTVDTAEEAVKAAQLIGFPIMVKAAAGGGGKGMRVARDASETRAAFALCESEAAASFGDKRLLVEKYVERPRHIEVQIVADAHGGIVHLGERECSIQRRNQKVLEEAPSAFVDEDMREQMGMQAVALAKAVGYVSAGTVECLVDGVSGEFYFLEMNTRLQVEHPITEAVTGVDLPGLMFRVAAGERLPFAQEDIRRKGWAMEARVYAEDPYRGFAPSCGVVRGYATFGEEVGDGARDELGFCDAGVRVDSGIEDAAPVLVHYDPLLAKVVARGETRKQTAAMLGRALDGMVIGGVEHNVPFLREITRNERFLSGEYDTGFIEKEFGEAGFTGVKLSEDEISDAVAVVVSKYFDLRAKMGYPNERDEDGMVVVEVEVAPARGGEADGNAMLRTCSGILRTAGVVGEDGSRRIEVGLRMDVDGTEMEGRSVGEPGVDRAVGLLNARALSGGSEIELNGVVDGRETRVRIVGDAPHDGTGEWTIYCGGALLQVGMWPASQSRMERVCKIARAKAREREREAARGAVRAPMPGVVVEVRVRAGDEVAEGEAVVVLEAMKMRNELTAGESGTIGAVHCREGDVVEIRQVLVDVESGDEREEAEG